MGLKRFFIFGATFALWLGLSSSVLSAEPQPSSHGNEIERVKKEIAADPGNTDRWMELAKLYGWAKEVSAAVKAYEKVLALDPSHHEAREKLVDFYSWVDEPGKSAEQIEWLLDRDPDNLELLNKLADRYMRIHRQQEAEGIYRKIIEKDPGNVKVLQGLADLARYASKHEEAVRRYREVLPYAVSERQKLDIYDKVADSYYYAQDYGHAREYAQEILRLDPDNEEALERLRKIEQHFRPRIFNDFRHLKLKGDSERFYNSAGFTKPTEHFTVTGTHKYYRVYDREIVTDRYGYDAAHVELSKYLGDGLTLAVGAEAKFYNVEDKARFDYYVRAVKDFQPGLRGDFLYEKETEDSDRDRLEQRVDRHRFSAAYYSDVTDFMTLNWNLEGTYYTKGNAFSDNGRFAGFVRPIFHISKKPVLDFSYLYYRIFTLEKDRNEVEQFEYFSPRVYDVHAAETYFRYDISKVWTVVAGDTISWIDEGDDTDKPYVKNTILGELIYKFGEDRKISVRYIKGRHVHSASATDYKDQELRVYVTFKF